MLTFVFEVILWICFCFVCRFASSRSKRDLSTISGGGRVYFGGAGSSRSNTCLNNTPRANTHVAANIHGNSRVNVNASGADDSCRFCGKTFKSKYTLNVHMKTHSNEKSFVCNICLKTFRLKHHLQSHSAVHNAEKPFQCIVCNHRFRLKHALRQHVLVKHNPNLDHEYLRAMLKK